MRTGIIPICLILLVAGVSLMPAGSAQATPGQVHEIAGETAELLEGPVEEALVVATLPRGARVMELKRQDDWVQVGVLELVGVKGWIRSTELVASASSAPAEQEAVEQDPAEETDEASDLPVYLLVVQPQAARRFRGQCNVGLDGIWAEPLRFSGSGLRSYRFRARFASCEIRSEGLEAHRFEVCLFRNGRLISYHGGAAVSRLIVRSEGPWDDTGQSAGYYTSGRVTGRLTDPPLTCRR
jgi:hypothetical protein